MASIPVWAIVAFFVVDTVVVAGVIFWALSRNKGQQNTPNSFNDFSAQSSASPFSSSTSSATGDSDILDALRRGQKIEAIKIYRERTKCDLKTAKDAVEAMARQM